MVWERAVYGQAGLTSLSDPNVPTAFPSDSAVSGKNSTLLLFTPNGTLLITASASAGGTACVS